MPDWKALVHEHLDLPELEPQQQAELIAELAAHLEDLCAEYRVQGLSEAAVIEHAQSELSVMNLSKNIRRARREERAMNSRTKQLLLPGLASMAIAIVAPVLLWWILDWFGFNSYNAASHHVAIKSDFLFGYLLGGAAGAYLCRRAGGPRLSRVGVALLPAAAYFSCVAFVLTAGLIEPGHFITGTGFAMVMYQAVLQPGALLLLGALPFLPSRSGHEFGATHA